MQRSKVFGWNDLAPLVDLLREIHREDLATKCEQFQLQLPSSKGKFLYTTCCSLTAHSYRARELGNMQTSWTLHVPS